MGAAFKFLWETGQQFLSFELDFGDVSFSLWDFCIASAVMCIIIVLVRRHFE